MDFITSFESGKLDSNIDEWFGYYIDIWNTKITAKFQWDYHLPEWSSVESESNLTSDNIVQVLKNIDTYGEAWMTTWVANDMVASILFQVEEIMPQK